MFHFEVGVLDEDDFDHDLDLREWGSTGIAMMWRRGAALESVRRRREKVRAKGS